MNTIAAVCMFAAAILGIAVCFMGLFLGIVFAVLVGCLVGGYSLYHGILLVLSIHATKYRG